MSDILIVTSSALGEVSVSKKIAKALVDSALSKRPTMSALWRDVSTIQPINMMGLSSLRIDEKDRTPQQAEAANYADAMIEEVENASVIVITAPMYTFTIPATLKSWIEYLNRPGRVFIHTDQGDRGLLVDKKVFVVITRGSQFKDGDPMNFQESYLKSVLGFFGMNDVTFIVAEGTASEIGKQQIEQATLRAQALGESLAD